MFDACPLVQSKKKVRGELGPFGFSQFCPLKSWKCLGSCLALLDKYPSWLLELMSPLVLLFLKKVNCTCWERIIGM